MCCKSKVREANEIYIKENKKIVFINEINIAVRENEWNKEVQIKIGNYNQKMVMKIDTGASVTVVPYNSKIPNIRPARTY